MVMPLVSAIEMIYNENMLPDSAIKQCLVEAGERVGLLDWRPQKLGEFGCFEVSKWKVK